jgi:hypothetical protein
MKGDLPWLVRWSCCAGTRDLCSALAALGGPVQNIFYVLLPDIIYVMQSGRFSQYPADGKRAG